MIINGSKSGKNLTFQAPCNIADRSYYAGIKLRRYLWELNALLRRKQVLFRLILLTAPHAYTPFIVTLSTNVSSTYIDVDLSSLSPILYSFLRALIFPFFLSLRICSSPWIYKRDFLFSEFLWILQIQGLSRISVSNIFRFLWTIFIKKLRNLASQLCVSYKGDDFSNYNYSDS